MDVCLQVFTYIEEGKRCGQSGSWVSKKLNISDTAALHVTEINKSHQTGWVVFMLFWHPAISSRGWEVGAGEGTEVGMCKGDTQTCSAVVSICAATIPNGSGAAPTKSVFVCIFITGVVRSRGDKERDKIAVGTVKTQQCLSYWGARNTLSHRKRRRRRNKQSD